MTNKDFTTELARRQGLTPQETTRAIAALALLMTRCWQDNDTINIQGFGSFMVRKRMELVTVNPVTQQRMLVPPRLVLGFKPSAMLKERLK